MNLEYWHWAVFGGVMLILEAALPGFMLVWFGLSALLVAGISFAFPELGTLWQVFIFGLSCLGVYYFARTMIARSPVNTDRPTLNRRGEQYIGQVFTLDSDLRDGRGRMRVGDTVWDVSGPSLDRGTSVQVVSVDGVTLAVVEAKVQAAPPSESAINAAHSN